MNLEYYISYIWRYIATYCGYLVDMFASYPLMVRICAAGVTIIALGGFFTFIRLVKNYRKRHLEYKIINRLDDRFRESLRTIMLNPDTLSQYEVTRILGYNRSQPFSKKEFRWFVRLFRDVRLECEDKANMNNINTIMRSIDFDNFANDMLKTAPIDDRMRLTRSLRFLGNHLKMEETIAKLRKSKIVVLRKTALFTYAWNSPNEALAYFDSEEFEKYFCLYDMMIFHDIMKRNAERGYSFPDLLNWVSTKEKRQAKALFIREMRYLGISDKCADMVPIFKNSKDADMNREIVTNWGEFQYREAEPVMIELYSYQEEKVQRAILGAVSNLLTGNAEQFLIVAYQNATDYDVKIEAIKSLFAYYRAGMLHTDLDSLAISGDEELFKYFHLTEPELVKEETTGN